METMRKAETMEMKGGNKYAKVNTRLKLFREENPSSKQESGYETREDGSVVFTVWLWRDKNDLLELIKAGITAKEALHASADANGTAKGETGKKEKDFEKLETIALGRALANIGYLADGEIASLEEMEDFYADKQAKQESEVEKWAIKLKATTDEKEMKKVWVAMPPFVKKELEDLKDELKATFKPIEDGKA